METGFRLARVLRLQQQMRRLRQHEADSLSRNLASIERKGASLAGVREQLHQDEARAARSGPLMPEIWWLRRTFDAALAFTQRQFASQAAEHRAALEAKRTQLAQERREERKFLRLEDTHRRRVLDSEDRASARLLDEIAIEAHRRTRKESKGGEE